MRQIDQGFGKRILIAWVPFLMFLGFSIPTQAQWVSVTPPDVSASWGLNKIRVLSSGNGWAVGVDVANKQGVILQFKDHLWTAVRSPKVSSNWELTSVFFTSVNDVWAVGVDLSTGLRSGVILHFINGLWTIVAPPFVSLDWALHDAFFLSSSEGWAVGVDYSNQRGVLLHFLNGIWTSVIPPDLSPDWSLSGIHMISTKEGWAVGVDHTNKRGALLQFTKDLAEKSTTRKRYIWQVVLPPQIDSEWELNTVFFTSATEGWAAGVNHSGKRGTLLHFFNSDWAEVIPPAVSSDWELNSIQFSSATAGWTAGVDFANKKGVMLQYDKGLWTASGLPDVSSDWDLGSVRFINVNEGWAAGTDFANQEGVLLRFSASTNETISTPSAPNGPTSISPNVTSTYFTGESLSSLDHSIQYFFDWGDGTNSGWLPVGTVGASKAWTSAGTYSLKAQARCATDTSVVSKSSSALSVSVSDTPTPITLLSPTGGTSYTGCSLYSLPTFTWEADGSFTGYEIQFSETESFDKIAASDKVSSASVLVDNNLWKKVLTAPGATTTGSSATFSSGGPMFWRVVGTRSDKSTVISDSLSFVVDPPEAVESLTIVNTSKSSVPILSWDNNCNVKFKVWFGNNANFFKKTSLSLNIKNPNDNGGIFTDSLNSSQWLSVQQLVGKVSGSPIWWYVESWDGANRRVISQPATSFVLTD